MHLKTGQSPNFDEKTAETSLFADFSATILRFETEWPAAVLQVGLFRASLSQRAGDVFSGGSNAAEPPADLKTLHVKIGQLTLENDFLESALTKAGLLRAKRGLMAATHFRLAFTARDHYIQRVLRNQFLFITGPILRQRVFLTASTAYAGRYPPPCNERHICIVMPSQQDLHRLAASSARLPTQ